MVVPKLRFKEFLGDWSKSTLGNISEIFDGTHQTPKYVDSGVKFVSVENINDLYSTDKYITKDAFDADFKNKPRANDILMTRITAGEIGATAIVKNDEPLGYYVSLALIRPNNYCLSGYLNQYISTNIFKNELHKRIIHTAFPKKINLGDINDCEVSYPSKDEQTKIANFLTAVDEKISQLNEQHQLMIQYKKGVMQKIFSQEIRFKDDNGEEFGEWEEKILGEISNPQQWKTISSSDMTESGYPVFGANGYIGFYSEYNHENETIAVTCCGATCGEVTLVKPKTYITGNSMSIDDIDEQKYSVKFIYYALCIRGFSDVITGSAQPQIVGSSIKKVKFLVPCIKEQSEIANFLTWIDQRIENLAHQLEQAKNWKKGLLQQMFV